MSKTATFLKKIDLSVNHGYAVEQRVYVMSPPHDGADFVLASAANAPYTGPETYLFPCDADGDVTCWGELDGSYRGGLDCDEAIRNAGYKVVR